MDLLLIAFAVFVVIELLKGFIPQPLPGWAKLSLALVVAFLLAVILGETGTMDERLDTLVLSLAGAGLAALVHKVHRWFSAAGDGHQLAVMQMGTRRR